MDKFIGIAIVCVIVSAIIFVIASTLLEKKWHKNYFIFFKKYNSVDVGASKSEVLFKLGNPQCKSKTANNGVLWIYSISYRKGKKLHFTLLLENDVVIRQSDIYQQ